MVKQVRSGLSRREGEAPSPPRSIVEGRTVDRQSGRTLGELFPDTVLVGVFCQRQGAIWGMDANSAVAAVAMGPRLGPRSVQPDESPTILA